MDQSKVSVVISWFFIIVIIVLIQFSVNRRISDSSSVDYAAGMQIQMTGKYFIGIKQIAGQNPVLKERLSKLEQGFQDNQQKSNHLASIPILAELSGREAALRELELMSADPESVADARNIPLFLELYKDGSDSLDSTQVSALKAYGWTGRLALSQDKPDSDPERKAVLKSALLMVIFIVMMTTVAAASLLGGITLFIIAIVQGIKGKLKSRLVTSEKHSSLLLETFSIYLVLSTVLPLILSMILPGFRNGGILMSILAGLIALVWPLLRGTGWKAYRTSLGWNRGKGVFREVGAGIAGYIAGLPLMLVAIIIVMILIKFSGETPTHPVVFDLSRSPFYLILLACVYAPLVEETMFRGALYGYLRRSLPWAASGIISGFIFAVLHPQGWVAVPALGVIGFNLSAIREWRGSIIASITAHALNNGSLVLILIVSLV